MMYIPLVLLSAYYAWRYAKIAIDPDQAMYMFEAMGVGWYGKDYADCKSPAIHIWFWLISKIVGRNVERIRFVHYFVVGLSSLLLFWLTGSFIIALVFLVLVNSGWIFGFNGNVGQIPAALIAVGLASGNEYILSLLMLVAVFFEPKLVVSLLIMAVLGLWWWYLPVGWLIAVIMGGLYVYWNDVFGWLVEANITIPQRMSKARRKSGSARLWMSWVTSMPYMYILPWLLLAVYATSDVLYWVPVLAYLLFIHIGLAVRPNHFLPIVGWIAMAITPEVLPFVAVLIIADWFSGGFYWSQLWNRFYVGIEALNKNSRALGLKLKELPGSLWVNGIESAVYIYAEKKVPYGLAEQIEIREVSYERRKSMVELWRMNPADYVVVGESRNIEFNGKGYKLIGESGTMRIFEKEKR